MFFISPDMVGCTLSPCLGREKGRFHCIQDQPGWHGGFQAIQKYTVKLCLENTDVFFNFLLLLLLLWGHCSQGNRDTNCIPAREADILTTDHYLLVHSSKSNPPISFPVCSKTPSAGPFVSLSLFTVYYTDISSLNFLPQLQHAFLVNPQTTPAREVCNLTTDLLLFLHFKTSAPVLSSAL